MHWLLDVFLDLLWRSRSWRFSLCTVLGVGATVGVYCLLPGGGYRVYLGVFFVASGFIAGLLWEMGRKRDDSALLRGEDEDREL